tara:strand:- start:131 stop:1216 length:1086 start_codon:yes stop_codon:yes gene_type:complete
MRITSGGNVLIGTTTDSGYKLDVNGTGRFSGDLRVDGAGIKLFVNGSNSLGGFFYQQSATGTTYANNMQMGASGDNQFWNYTTGGGWVKQLSIATTGAATFSGQIIANANNGAISVSGTGYSINPTNMLIGMYTSSIGYIQVPSSGRIDIWNGATGAIATFYNNSNVQFNGNVGIGTTTNTNHKLTVHNATDAGQIRVTGGAPTIYFTDTLTDPANYVGLLGMATGANNFITGTAAGDFVLLNQTNSKKLYVVNYSGGVYLSSGATSWAAISDIRLKNINSHIENAVEKLSTLQTINFSYKDDKTNKQNLGLIAQEVEKIFPELIDKNGDGMLGVRYTELVPVLIKAVQELKLEIETLKNK